MNPDENHSYSFNVRLIAPAAFTGDLSAYQNGQLYFQFHADSGHAALLEQVVLTSADGTKVHSGIAGFSDPVPGRTDWGQYHTDILRFDRWYIPGGSSQTLTSAAWDVFITQITRVEIGVLPNGEFFFDDVQVLPEALPDIVAASLSVDSSLDAIDVGYRIDFAPPFIHLEPGDSVLSGTTFVLSWGNESGPRADTFGEPIQGPGLLGAIAKRYSR